MSVFTLNRSRVSVRNRSEALTRNLLSAAKHTDHWNEFTVARDIAREDAPMSGKRVRRG